MRNTDDHLPPIPQRHIRMLISSVVLSTVLVLLFGSEPVRWLFALGLLIVSPWLFRRTVQTARQHFWQEVTEIVASVAQPPEAPASARESAPPGTRAPHP